jgi:DNA-directed RNA polymerase specialized sigma24 family protein
VKCQILDRARRIYGKKTGPIESPLPLDPRGEGEIQLEARPPTRQLPEIEEMTRSLPTRERVAILMTYRDGLGTEDVARELGCGRRTAQRTIRAGLEMLSGMVDPRLAG